LLVKNEKIRKPEILKISDHNILPESLDKDASSIVHRLNEAGFEAYIVGGFVRDSILGLKPKDSDVVTNATPDEIKKIVPKTRIIGRRFKIVHARAGRRITEISTFRAADKNQTSKSNKGLILRDNNYGTIEQDAFRRDFTINSLYLDLQKMEVLDFTGGYTDLKNRILKTIGKSSERFREDPVRILRAIRFKSKLDLELDPEIEKDIHKLSYLLEEIPSGRNYEETLKMFMTGSAEKIFLEMQTYNLTKYLLPQTKNFLSSKKDKRFILNALRDTDQRYRNNQTLTPSFLFSVLLWPALVNKTGPLNFKKIKITKVSRIANFILKKHNENCFIPKRIQQSIKETWELQILLMKIPEKAHIAIKHKRFRAAYDFLLLREKSGEKLNQIGDWWTKKITKKI